MADCTTAVMPGGVCPDCGWVSGKSAAPHQVAMTGAHFAPVVDEVTTKRERAELMAITAHMEAIAKENADLKAENVSLKAQLAPPPLTPPVMAPVPPPPVETRKWPWPLSPEEQAAKDAEVKASAAPEPYEWPEKK